MKIDYAAIIEILIQQLDSDRQSSFISVYFCTHSWRPDDEIQQSTALRWLADFLSFTPDVMVPFTPRLIPAILPNLAHHVQMIHDNAIRTNKLLLSVIQNLPSPTELPAPRPASERERQSSSRVPPIPASPTPTSNSIAASKQSTVGRESVNSSRELSSPEITAESSGGGGGGVGGSGPSTAPLQRSKGSVADLTPRAATSASTDVQPSTSNQPPSRPHSPLSLTSQPGVTNNVMSIPQTQSPEEADPFDYQATVNELTIQFLSEFEDTRVAALKWLIMLHQKAPKKV